MGTVQTSLSVTPRDHEKLRQKIYELSREKVSI